jgi:DNA-binding Lrp family transcriptional regulator
VNGGRPLGRQILAILAAESGASFEELTERTGASYAEVKAVVWRLYGAKLADICHGYVVPAPSGAEGRRAA